MGSLFRSEEMRLCQLFLQAEAAYACVSELGELGIVQFKDLNANVNAFQRKFVNEVRRCEEMERKLRFMEKEITKAGMKIYDTNEAPRAPPPKEMVDLEVKFDNLDSELRQVNTNEEALKQNYLELNELQGVLRMTEAYFALHGSNLQHIMDGGGNAHEEAVIGSRSAGSAQLGFVVGTILRDKVAVFERVMRYITHNNVLLRTDEIEQPLQDPITGDLLQKNMFIIFYQGDQLKSKVWKICDGMRCNLYPISESVSERAEMLKGVSSRLTELESVLESTKKHKHRVLENIQTDLRAWSIKAEKIKAIFHTLNMFRGSSNSLIAECWCPVKSLEDIRDALTRGEKISGSPIPTVIQPMQTNEQPPTYYNCNKFVKGYQAIVDAYGVSTYGEVNPTPYTCITFPFLFAVMFGDAGHGLIMFLFGAWMCVKETSLAAAKSTNEIWNTFFSGRYIIMLMGLFSVYTGFIYNDVFSRSVNIFGSQWTPEYSEDVLRHNETILLNARLDHINSTAYFFGIDPIWQTAKNKIVFVNSLKMKMAIILGVCHMMFGICLSVFNHIHFKKKIDILLKFVPEILFLGCLFGYLVGIVIFKWIHFDAETSKCAPPLLIHYINMFMLKYSSSNHTCDHRDPIDTFYDGQQSIQTTLLVVAVMSVPVLLIIRPAYEIHEMKKGHHRGSDHHQTAPLIDHEVMPASPKAADSSTTQPKPGHLVPVGEVNLGYQNDDNTELPSARMSLNSDEMAGGANGNAVSQTADGDDVAHSGHGEEVNKGEIIMESAIETIEFCLGCISHTASYLRLWALSLAHAQLSEVLWTMVMHMGFSIGGKYVGGIILFAIFFFWANLTIGILLLMEGLSAFLHTLRLHWVEFQSKFYSGEGYHFTPFSFKSIMTMQSLEDVM